MFVCFVSVVIRTVLSYVLVTNSGRSDARTKERSTHPVFTDWDGMYFRRLQWSEMLLVRLIKPFK